MKLFSVNKFIAGVLMLLLQVVSPHSVSAQGCLVNDLTLNNPPRCITNQIGPGQNVAVGSDVAIALRLKRPRPLHNGNLCHSDG